MKVEFIFTGQKEHRRAWFGKKKKKEKVSTKFKNEWSIGRVMLLAYWNYRVLVYTEFGPDAFERK